MVAHVEQDRVAAGREQAEERRLERLRQEEERRDVAVQVVDRREWKLPPEREPLRRRQPHEESADQAGALSDGDELEIVQRSAAVAERLSDDRSDQLDVAP